MDEITSDLDIFAREGILGFLRSESEIRGATIFYCTHIFDHLEGWASHMLHMSKGRVVRSCPMEEVSEYHELIAQGHPTPLYSVIRKWIYSEYEVDGSGYKPWRKLEDTSDGRRPALGLAHQDSEITLDFAPAAEATSVRTPTERAAKARGGNFFFGPKKSFRNLLFPSKRKIGRAHV